MNSPNRPSESERAADTLNESILKTASNINPVYVASAKRIKTTEATIAEQLVIAGADEAEIEKRLAAGNFE